MTMRIYEVKEEFLKRGVALTSARNIRIVSDVMDDGTHPFGLAPAELLGNALGSCLLINSQKIANKMRVNISNASVDLKVYWQENPPKVFKIEYVFHLNASGIPEEKLNKLLEYTLKYSTTYNTLKESVEIVGRFDVKR
jgi:putative redox protein